MEDDTSLIGSPAAKAYDDGYAVGFNREPQYLYVAPTSPPSERRRAYDRGYADGCKAREFEKNKPNTAAAYRAFAIGPHAKASGGTEI
jgi:hypothetical protein